MVDLDTTLLEKPTSMKNCVDILLMYILRQIDIKYYEEFQYYFVVDGNDGISLSMYKNNNSHAFCGNNFFKRPDLIPLVRVFNYIVYGR